MGSNNGHGEAIPLDQAGAVAIKLWEEHRNEIVKICHRLCQLMPPGCNYCIAIGDGKPRIVTAGGAPVGREAQVIHISRPVAVIQQGFTVNA